MSPPNPPQFEGDDVPWPVSEPLPGPAACKFAKDEKDAVEEDSLSAEVPTLDRMFGEGGFASPTPRAGPEGSTNLDFWASVMTTFDPSETPPPVHRSWHVMSDEPQYGNQFADGTGDPMSNSYSNVTQRSPAFPGAPPQRECVICSDKASGCHYGVLTCGSCKVFFKRAVEGHHIYLCAGRNDCIVDKIRRKNCPACRLQKCYQAGMMLGDRRMEQPGSLEALGFPPPPVRQSHLARSSEAQASIGELQFSQQIITILANIEPGMVSSDNDGSQAEVPHLLLSCLNRLCEKQLVWIVKWAKSLPGFQNLHLEDQMTLIQYSWMNLCVFSLGWRSFQNVTNEFLYFAPDLILSQEQMRRSSIYEVCLAIQFIPQEFTSLQVTTEEYLCMKAIILLNTVPLEGLKSQLAFEEMRKTYIHTLIQATYMKERGMVASSQRFFRLTKLMDSIHEIVKKASLSCLSVFIQAEAMQVEFPEMMREVITSQLLKVVAGMVKPLLFHSPQ